jgi:NAD(P)-dependent dehydrogenase (short-subunit alcohol dehydrogenase family)
VDRPLQDRIALVTGTSRGIGRATAVRLAELGAHLVAIARTEGALTELDDEVRAVGGSATLVPLDLRDGDAIDGLGRAVFERWGRLDVLVANAGVLGPLSPLGHVPVDKWEQVMAVNLTANWRLIRSMDPLIRQSDAARAVFVTSGASRNLRAYWGPYSVSKAGLDALARTYANELANTPHCVNLFNPGPTRTKMRAEAMPGENPDTLPAPEVVADALVRLCLPQVAANGGWYDFPSGGFID